MVRLVTSQRSVTRQEWRGDGMLQSAVSVEKEGEGGEEKMIRAEREMGRCAW